MKAHENFLQFSPQFGEGRYLLEIRGFTDPTDIMILKDEINWIRGYTVIPEDTVGSRVYYSVYFEDDCDGDEIYTLGCPGERRNEALKVMEPFGVVPVDSIRYINMSENEVYHN